MNTVDHGATADPLHECIQRDRLNRLDSIVLGNGEDGLMTKFGRMDVRITWILRINWFMVTTWVLTIVAITTHFLLRK